MTRTANGEISDEAFAPKGESPFQKIEAHRHA
jgi:hypothetical protein